MTSSPASQKLQEAEAYVARADKHWGAKPALFGLGNASEVKQAWAKEDIARALRVVDAVARFGEPLKLKDIISVAGHCSVLGDACGVRIISKMSRIPRTAFADEPHLISCIGPQTLRALLRRGADPNGEFETDTPLAGIMNPFSLAPGFSRRFEVAAILLAAGAIPTNTRISTLLVVPFDQLCDLRPLSALWGAAVLARCSAPAALFVRRDGDSAIAHRVREFLAARDLLVSS
jgi:hypothetical protein